LQYDIDDTGSDGVAAMSGGSSQTAIRRRPRIAPLVLGALLLLVQWTLWTGSNGALEYVNLKRDVEDAQARNRRLAERNRLLTEDVLDLKSRDDAIEELARDRLGMIREGEKFYQVVERP
jgi:cell division protein FtsB